MTSLSRINHVLFIKDPNKHSLVIINGESFEISDIQNAVSMENALILCSHRRFPDVPAILNATTRCHQIIHTGTFNPRLRCRRNTGCAPSGGWLHFRP